MGKRGKRIYDFEVGQRVRLNEAGRRALLSRSQFKECSEINGTIQSVWDLSDVMPDDPFGPRNFYLNVWLDGMRRKVTGNAMYFDPI